MKSLLIPARIGTGSRASIMLLGILLLLPNSAASAEESALPAIEVSEARTHPNAGVPVGVVYLRLQNRSKRDDRLLRVETKAAKRAELHESIAVGDRVRMKHHPEGFPIAAGGEIVLQPGGKHVMLMQLAHDLELGGSIELTLVFASAGKLDVLVPVRPRAF